MGVISAMSVFYNIVNCIQTETADPLIHPELDHPVQLFPKRRIFPVQIRLHHAEAVIIVFLNFRHPFPGASAKECSTALWRLLFCAFLPDVKIMILTVSILFRFQKPRMQMRTVIENKIHHDHNSPFFAGCNQFFQLLHRTRFFHYFIIVTDIVSIIIIWGIVKWRKPDRSNAKLLQIIQFLQNPSKIADAVSVAVTEASGVNLIYG